MASRRSSVRDLWPVWWVGGTIAWALFGVERLSDGAEIAGAVGLLAALATFVRGAAWWRHVRAVRRRGGVPVSTDASPSDVR